MILFPFKKKPKELFNDVVMDDRKRLLDLHKTPMVEFHLGRARNFLSEHWEPLAILFITFFAGFVVLSFAHTGRADVANFYPSSCLGAWQHPENAQGSPNLSADAKPEDFNSSNSAIAKDQMGSIFCGGFKGSVPDNSVPKSFKLALNWEVDDGSVVHYETSAPDAPAVQVTIPDVVQPTPTPTPAPATTPDITLPADNVPPTEAPNVPTPPADPVPADTSAPQSFLYKILGTYVFAQDTAPTVTADTPAETTTSGDAFAEVDYTLDGTNWQVLGTVNRNAWKNASFNIPLNSWTSLDKLQVEIKPLQTIDAVPVIYLDSMSLGVSYDAIQKDQTPPTILLKDSSAMLSGQADFNSNEDVTFTVVDPNLDTTDVKQLVTENKAQVIKDTDGVLGMPVNQPQNSNSTGNILQQIQNVITPVTDKVTSFIFNIFSTTAYAQTDTPAIVGQVLDNTNTATDIPVTIETIYVGGQEKHKVHIQKPSRNFRPGKYTLQVTLTTPSAVIISEQDFTWGVLSVNTDKSIYAAGDNAYLQMGVLDDHGSTICDADLDLVVTSPSGVATDLNTTDGGIIRNPECHGNDVINNPDYYTHYTVPSESGIYQMVLTANTTNGVKTIHDTFSVAESVPFDVSREGPTRVFPGAVYPMVIHITPAHNWTGTIIEKIPSNFTPSAPTNGLGFDSSVTDGDTTTLIWTGVTLEAGKEKILGYTFLPPPISPQFYLVGPLSFYYGTSDYTTDMPVFQESRQWQIADDAVCTATITGTWNTTNTGSMWTGCTGTNGTPGTADDVVINSSVVITLGAATPAVTSLTINGTLTTSASNFALNSKSISIGTTGTLTGNNSIITVSGTTGTLMSITGSGVFNAGTSTVTVTGNGSNTLNTAGFTGSNAFAKLTINITGVTKTLGGDLTVGSALAVTLGTLNTSATSNYALSAGSVSVAAASANLSINASTLTITGTGTNIFSIGATASFTAGTNSTVIFNGNGNFTNTALNVPLTFYNLTLSPVLTSAGGNITYTFLNSASLFTVNGNFMINPSESDGSSKSLTVTTTTMTVDAGHTTTIKATGTGGSSPTSILSFNARAFSTGFLDLQSNGTITGNASAQTTTITGTATSADGVSADSVLKLAGIFTPNLMTISFTGGTTNTLLPAVTYNILSFNNSAGIYYLTGNTVLNGALSVTNGTFDTTAAHSYSLTATSFGLGSVVTSKLLINASLLTLTGSAGNIISAGSTSAVFTAGTGSTVKFTGNGSLTVQSVFVPTFYNLTFAPVLTTGVGNITYTFNGFAAIITVNGDFTINPSESDGGSQNLNVITTALSIDSGHSTIVKATGTGGSSPTSSLSLSNRSFSTGFFDVQSNGSLIGNTVSALSISITGTGTSAEGISADHVFNILGSFTANLTDLTFTGGSTNTQLPAGTYHGVTLNNVSFTYYLTGDTTFLSNLFLTSGTLDTTTSNYALTALAISLSSTFLASTLNLHNSLVTITTATGTAIASNGSATISVGSSQTIKLTGNGTLIVESGLTQAINNLVLAPVLTSASNITYTFTSGSVTMPINGDFTINPTESDGGSGVLNVTGSTITVDAGHTTTIGATSTGGPSTPTASFSMLTYNRAFSTGFLNILSNGSFAGSTSAAASITGTTTSATGTSPNNIFQCTGTFTANTGTINITGGSSATLIPGLSYYNLIFNNSSATYLFAGTMTVNPAAVLTVTAGTLSTSPDIGVTSYNLSVGRLLISAGGTFTANASQITINSITLNQIFACAGNFNAGTSTVIINPDVAINGMFSTSVVVTFYNLTFSPALSTSRTWATASGSNYSIAISNQLKFAPTAVSGTPKLTVTGSTGINGFAVGSSGSFLLQPSGGATVEFQMSSNFSAGSLDVESGATLSPQGGVVMTVNGTTSTPFIVNSGIFNKNLSTVSFTGGSGTTTIPGLNYYNLMINSSVVGVTFAPADNNINVDTAGAFTITTGAFSTSPNSGTTSYNLTAGKISIAASSASFTANNSTITLNATSGVLLAVATGGAFTPNTSTVIATSASGNPSLVNGTVSLYNLTINSTATVINSSTVTINNNFLLSSGVYNQYANSGIGMVGNTTGTFTMSSGTTFCLGGAPAATTATCDSGATYPSGVSFPSLFTGAHISISPTSTFIYLSNSNNTISSTPTYGNLYLRPVLTTNFAYTFASGITNVAGNFDVIPSGTGTLTVNLASGGINVTGSTTVEAATGVTTPTCTGTCASVLDAVSNNPTTTGSITIASNGTMLGRTSTITVSGNWTNSGTFTPATSTVVLTSGTTAVVSGTTTFYNFSITPSVAKEVDFAVSGSPVFHVTGLFTGTGHVGALVKLRSVSFTVQWKFHPTGTSNVSYLDVQDGACQAGYIMMSPSLDTNSGNNDLCWGFSTFIVFNISSGSVGFGNLSSSNARYCNAVGTGSATDVEGNNLTVTTFAAGGYSVFVQGASLSSGNHTITAMGNSNIAPSPGFEQFGLRAIATGGLGVVQSPYDGSGFAFPTNASTVPSVVASASSGNGVATTYSIHYVADIAPLTPAGNYSTSLTYIVSGSF